MSRREEQGNQENLENSRKRKTATPRLPDDRSPIRIADQLDEVCTRMRTQGYAANTISRYRCCIDDFAKYLDAEGIRDVRAVLREQIETYQAQLNERKLSASTRAQNIQAVSRLFEDLVERGMLLLNPTASVRRATRRDCLPRRVPTRAQVKRLLEAPNTSRRTGIRDRAMLEVLYGSALRVEELVRLSIHDVDLEHWQVRIERGKRRKGRVVPLSGTARDWLDEYLTCVRPWWTQGKPRRLELFLTHSARPMKQAAVRQVMVHLCRALELERISPHGLRHAAATHMVAAGADIRHVQRLLGHKSVETTQRYTRVRPQEVKATHAASHPREKEG